MIDVSSWRRPRHSSLALLEYMFDPVHFKQAAADVLCAIQTRSAFIACSRACRRQVSRLGDTLTSRWGHAVRRHHCRSSCVNGTLVGTEGVAGAVGSWRSVRSEPVCECVCVCAAACERVFFTLAASHPMQTDHLCWLHACGRVSGKDRRLTCKRVHVMVLCHGHGHHGGQRSATNKRHALHGGSGSGSRTLSMFDRRACRSFCSVLSQSGRYKCTWLRKAARLWPLLTSQTHWSSRVGLSSWLSGRGSPSLARC